MGRRWTEVLAIFWAGQQGPARAVRDFGHAVSRIDPFFGHICNESASSKSGKVHHPMAIGSTKLATYRSGTVFEG